MQVVRSISELRRSLNSKRQLGNAVGLVPTMGALHDGHRALLKRARAECDTVVMSLFVNPTQFDERADFDKYPRTEDADAAIAQAEQVDFVFAPSAAEVYPAGFDTTVRVGRLGSILEGKSRPGHFDGVATVVCKLLLAALPSRAYFGLKDYQQLQVITRMTADLNIPTEIVACETVREADGLAMSSRNARLGAEERAAAVVLSAALRRAQDHALRGADPAEIRRRLISFIAAEPQAELDYAVVVDRETLEDVETLERGAIALVAAGFGPTRLIDNADLCAQVP